MNTIKFGTDGWRAIIADDFTLENLKRVAFATGVWLKGMKPQGGKLERSAVVGYDCRFGGKLFAETTARILASNGIKVYLSGDFASTPMVSLGTVKLKADAGIIITASHNPPSYNGYKIKGSYGGPALPSMIEEIEKQIQPSPYGGPFQDLDELLKQGSVEMHDLETLYVDHAEASFDMRAIRMSGLKVAYDAMFGAGQNAVRRLLPEAAALHAEFNPGFHGVAPEPIVKNLHGFIEMIRREGDVDFAFATDGDADRIGVLDKEGNFIDSHHIILILVNYLHNYKKMKGKVVNSFSCTSRISSLCKKFNIENVTTKIGFKYICEYMIHDTVLVGGEESGGIAVMNHIPERDGVWIALTLLEFMAKAGKTLQELIDEIYHLVGPFALERYDLHVSEEDKRKIAAKIKSGISHFGAYQVNKVENLDGHKFILPDGKWVMARASGTEPVLRLYAEAASHAEAVNILDTAETVLF